MTEYIEREAFVEQKRKQYCEDCSRRKGMKNGKYKTLYEIGEAPCRACEIDDMLNDVEDFPAADVRPVVHGEWIHTGGKFSRNKTVDRRILTCSVCGNMLSMEGVNAGRGDANYCPNCGARMEES